MTAPTSQMARGAVGFHSWHQPRWHKKMVAGSNGAGCKKFDQVNRGQVNNPLLTADVLTKSFVLPFSAYICESWKRIALAGG